jgi:septum site-determining protein MinD
VRVIGVVSGKGGVGKTTVAVNLGSSLATRAGKNVMLIDCNVTTPHVPLHLGMDNMHTTLNHVIRGSAELRDAIYSHASGIKVMPASMSLGELDGLDMFQLKSVVNNIYDRFFGKIDFLILDCAPGFGREAMSAIKSCNELLLVSTPHTPAVMDTVRCKHIGEGMDLKVLGTVLNKMTGHRGELKRDDVELITGTKVLASIPFDKRITKSLAAGMPVTIHKKGSRSSKAIGRLADSIL